MRPITKVLLSIVAAFVVYLLWPRAPEMVDFSPPQLAELQIESWQNEQSGGFGQTLAAFKTFAFGYGFSPIASFQIAHSAASSAAILRDRLPDLHVGSETRALVPLQEKYVVIQRQTEMDFDSDACARAEIAWRVIELDGGKPQAVAQAMASFYATFYGGEPGMYLDSAKSFAGARALLNGAPLPEGYSSAHTAALDAAVDGFDQLLKAIHNGNG